MTDLQAFWKKNRLTWWYALCFALLGFIDQRRGSAVGNVQMMMTNLTGPVLACMLLPSMKREFIRIRPVRIWSAVCAVGMPAAMLLGARAWEYQGQWNTAVINAAVFGFLALYVVWDRKEIMEKSRLNKACFFVVMGMLFLMQCSVHEAFWPVWFLGYFGCFYLIGIPKEWENTFVRGMLEGIILWFFVQQIIAFGFRPYDYVRYRGLYSGETQSGLFYMIVFCAFTCTWLWLRREKAKWPLKLLCFLLSAGSLGFLLLTGGRSSLFGAVAAAILGYMLYDILMSKSFKHWILQGVLLGVCTAVLFPAVYCSVRYLPTILHHPIWFEGEYNAAASVHSFDPWDSEKYVSFELAVNYSVGRILRLFGIHFEIGNTEDTNAGLATPWSLTAHAAEAGEPGSSQENPFYFEGKDYVDPIVVRGTIYYYYFTHLNFAGHSKANPGFYLGENGIFMDHAHDMFLQIAYDYGILPGILFLGWSVACMIRLIRRKDMTGIICVTFFAAIIVYGLTEMAVTTGQITFTLMFIIYYFAMQKSFKTD